MSVSNRFGGAKSPAGRLCPAWLVVIALLLAACTPPSPAAPAAKPTASAGVSSAPAVAAAAPTAAPSPTPAAPLKVRLGGSAIGAEAGYFVAMDRGYFAEEGIEIDFVVFQRSSEQIPPLATGELQFGSITLDGSLFNAAQRDIELKIISYNSLLTPTHFTGGVVLRQDLLDSGRYREPADLKGMSIALSSLGATPQMFTERILAWGGLTGDDVTYPLLSFPDMVTAMANRAVDGAWLVEPFTAISQTRGIARTVASSGEAYPGAVTMVLVISPVFAQDQPDAARRFVTALLRGQRDYYRAIVLDQGGREEIYESIARHTPVKDLALYPRMGMHAIDPNGAMDERVLNDYQDYFVRMGTQQRKLDLGRIIDRSAVNGALDRLGRLP